ncbi:MAG TPA: hypothetical protein VGK26_00905 [Thermoanaerobaculia bacterium]|jgi:hypothetical protein
MRRTYARIRIVVGILLALGTAGTARAACTASGTTLCLNDGRFAASVAWKDFQGRTGVGRAIPITADTGYFWFFSPANIELVIKALDARAVNGKYWIFFGALSNVEYTLTVTDTLTGSQKQYVNPSGQFASVGDTKAFDPSGISTTSVRVEGTMAAPASIPAVQRRIDLAQPATADFTPCPDAPHGFNLGGCRFHIEVDWTDGRGRSGLGQPVQLTDDTGYFWFFSDANVELMVKVLDARGVNGQFWVFFGALSNVQYAVTVTDTVTGTYRKYLNPSGAFASVGDTAAFRGGTSVTPATDSANSSAMDLDQTGGSVTALGADGTVFTLEVPPYALPAPTTITLTPVSRVDRFPFSGGLVAGVEIGPAGTDLLLPAILTIQPASPPAPEETLPFAYASRGEDLILYPRDPDSASLQLPIARLGGFGVGHGTPAEADALLQRKPTGALAVYLQRYAGEVYRYERGLIDRSQLTDNGVQIYRDAVADLDMPAPNDASSTRQAEGGGLNTRCIFQDRSGHDYDVGQDVARLIGIIRQRQMLGLEDDQSTQILYDEIINTLTTCMQKAFDRCVANTDPYEALQMLQIAQQLSVLGVEDERLTSFLEDSLLERCLRFEIDFDSKIVDDATRSGSGATVSYEQTSQYRAATVPLRLDLGNFYAGAHGAHDGSCTLVPEDTTFVYTAGTRCTVSVTHAGNGLFDAAAAWIGILNLDPSKSEIVLLYDPGAPEITGSLKCPAVPAIDIDLTTFEPTYGILHDNEFSGYGLYAAAKWDLLRIGQGPSQNREFVAQKSYLRSMSYGQSGTLREETFFFLKHTPDAPMPPCN